MEGVENDAERARARAGVRGMDGRAWRQWRGQRSCAWRVTTATPD